MRDSETSGRFGRPVADRSRILSTECRAGTVAWRARFDQDPVAPKFCFRVNAEGGRGVPTWLEVEIGTCEIRTFDGPASLPLKIDKHGFSDEAANSMLLHEEMLATKLRALLWRDQGRGLCDLAYGLEVFRNFDIARMPRCWGGISSFPARRAPVPMPECE